MDDETKQENERKEIKKKKKKKNGNHKSGRIETGTRTKTEKQSRKYSKFHPFFFLFWKTTDSNFFSIRLLITCNHHDQSFQTELVEH